MFNFKNFKVLLDYAHNPAGFRAMKDFVDQTWVTKILEEKPIQSIGSSTDDFQHKGETIDATILFADICGFTSMAECVSPEMLVDSLQDPQGAFVMWVRSGHEVKQERKRVVMDLMDVLCFPQGDGVREIEPEYLEAL